MKIKTLSLLGALAVLTVSCAKDDNRMTGYGELSFQLSADYEAIPVSKASAASHSKAENALPDVDNFSLSMTKEDGSFSKEWEKASEFPQESKFPTGNYTMKAWYGNKDNEGFDSPYYEGTTRLSIRENELSHAEITCYLANVKLTGRIYRSIQKIFYRLFYNNSFGRRTVHRIYQERRTSRLCETGEYIYISKTHQTERRIFNIRTGCYYRSYRPSALPYKIRCKRR